MRKLLAFMLVAVIFASCDSVGTYQEEDYQWHLDNAHILQRNLNGLVNNYQLSKDEINILCTDSIKNRLKIVDGKVDISLIDIYALGQFSNNVDMPNFPSLKSPNLFYDCVNTSKTAHAALRTFSVINKSDTVWEETTLKSEALEPWLVTLDEWSDRFWDENVAIFYTINDRSKFPQLYKDYYDPGVLAGFLILLDWKNLKPICSIPCSVTNSNEIEYIYYPGTENIAAKMELNNDLLKNLNKNLIKQFNEIGINGIDSLELHY